MKTTKKGFTLIELIVVIAIIGVLAAILVPSMLGYVKKSKIQSANTAASSIYKAVNSACTELDETDLVAPDNDYTHADGATTFTDADDESFTNDLFYEYVEPYFEDIEDTDCAFTIRDNTCQAVAVESGSYYGTYPQVYTSKNWDDLKPGSLEDALADAKEEADVTEAEE